MEAPSEPMCHLFVIDRRTHILLVCGMPGISEDVGFTGLLSDEAQWRKERLDEERREAFAAAGLSPFASPSETGVHADSTPCIPKPTQHHTGLLRVYSSIFKPAQE